MFAAEVLKTLVEGKSRAKIRSSSFYLQKRCNKVLECHLSYVSLLISKNFSVCMIFNRGYLILTATNRNLSHP